EAEPGQDPRRPARRRARIDLVEPRLDLGDAQRLRSAFQLGHQPGALAIGGEHGIERVCRAARRLLREETDTAAARHADVDALPQPPAGGRAGYRARWPPRSAPLARGTR